MTAQGDRAHRPPARQDADAQDEFSREAAGSRPPGDGVRLTSTSDEKAGKRATPSPAPQKTSGLGPAIAERSKDAKAPRSGRQPGAYVKE